MYLSSISIQHFRNYEAEEATFRAGVVCLYGPNGAGKTNFLDAVHYVCSARSALFSEEAALLKEAAPYFTLKAQLHLPEEAPLQLFLSYKPSERKHLEVDGRNYERRSDYASHAPVLMISSSDSRLLQGTTQPRRDFMDALLLQESPDYREQWQAYKHYLRARNAALRAPLSGNSVDKTLLKSYDERILPLARQISTQRLAFLEEYLPLFQSKYTTIAGEREVADLVYISDALAKDFETRYSANLQTDMQLMRTEIGIHRDDYLPRLRTRPLRTYASQGQQKTFLWALKLTHAERLYRIKKRVPLLLLDDIFDKLDTARVARLFELLLSIGNSEVTKKADRQIFISNPEKPTTQLLSSKASDLQLLRIENGCFCG